MLHKNHWPQESHLIKTIKRCGPQAIGQSLHLNKLAGNLVAWGLARYNGAGLLELITTKPEES